MKIREDVIHLLTDTPDWAFPWQQMLLDRGLPVKLVDLRDHALSLDPKRLPLLVINKASPSAHQRGARGSVSLVKQLLELYAELGVRVVNGSRAFGTEVSKTRQIQLARMLDIPTPKTLLFNGAQHIREVARDFPFPALMKPDMGGSGAGVRTIQSVGHLADLLADPTEEVFGPDHLLLLQEELIPDDGAILRTEFVGDQLLYGMKVFAQNTFNLCPATGCARPAADPEGPAPSVRFEHAQLTQGFIELNRRLLRLAGLEIGGAEFIVRNGHAVLLDINASSVFREDIPTQSGREALTEVGDFIRDLYWAQAQKYLLVSAGTEVLVG